MLVVRTGWGADDAQWLLKYVARSTGVGIVAEHNLQTGNFSAGADRAATEDGGTDATRTWMTTRRTERFAAIAMEVTACLARAQYRVDAHVIDAEINRRIEAAASTMNVTTPTALARAPDGIGAAIAKHLIEQGSAVWRPD